MTTQIGRLTFPLRPEVYQVGSGKVVLAGAVQAGSLGKADHLRRQVAELAGDGAEDVIPVIIEDGFSGFVRPTSSTVDTVSSNGLRLGMFRYAIEGDLVLAHGLPVVESLVAGAVRQNAHGIAADDAHPFHAVPGAAQVHVWPDTFFVDAGDTESRSVEGGTVEWSYAVDFSTGDPTYNGIASWLCDPQDWYMGACGVERLVDGEYLPLVAPGEALTDTWRMTNGMVRFTVDGTDLRFSWWSGTAWSSDLIVTSTAGDVWRTARVVSLAPDSVTLALAGDPGGGHLAAFMTATIRRGSPWVSFRARDNAGPEIVTASAVTDLTYGMRLTTAVDGWVWMVVTDVANTVSPSVDPVGVYLGGDIRSFGVASYHSSWTGNLALGQIHKEWFAVQGERPMIGTRL